MIRENLADKLSKGLFFVDGAMGTQLMARGVKAGKCSESLNVENSDVVIGVHSDYFAAGSDAVFTNTFGGNELSLGRHGFGDDVERLNLAAAKNARQAAGEEKYVIGDIGPCGDFLQPLGTLEPARLKDVFARQAAALLEGGVDGFVIETFTAIDEAKIAVQAVRSICSLPVFVSLAFDPAGDDFRTMMGVGIETAIAEIAPLSVNALGFNCGTLQMEQYLSLTEKYASKLDGSGILLLAEPNAGKPELVDGGAVYKLGADEFADWGLKIRNAGAAVLGGCCGTSPEHIKALTAKIAG